MSQVYICAVSSRFPENYEIGIRAGKWGVERKYRDHIAAVRPGDSIVFVVGGEFRSIHRVMSRVYEDRSPLWPLKDGDPFPFRIEIGPAEAMGSVSLKVIARRISFMRDKEVPTGTIQGANGVFNARATPEDLEIIRRELLASPGAVESAEAGAVTALDPIVPAGEYWWPGLLDQLADLAKLRRTERFPDPFADAQQWRTGLLAGVFADQKETPTLAIAPFDRSPPDTVLSTLYGLSAVKQATEAKQVRGVIFVQRNREEVVRLTSGLPNLTTFGFEVRVALRA